MSNQSNSASSTSSSTAALQECILAGSSPSSPGDMERLSRCQQQQYGHGDSSSSPMNIFMDVLKSKADDLHSSFSSITSFSSSTSSSSSLTSNSSSAAATLSKSNAHAALIQDFNVSSRVWKFSL